MVRQSVLAIAAMCIIGGCESSNNDRPSSDQTSAINATSGTNSMRISNTDNKFLMQVTQANQAEVQMGQMAVQRSQNSHVKQLAQQMVDDHSKAGEQVQQLASSKNATLPSQLDGAHQQMVDKLRDCNSDNFDKCYVDEQVTAHQETIHQVQNEINNGDDSDVKALAQQLLPTLQHHLEMAQDCQRGM